MGLVLGRKRLADDTDLFFLDEIVELVRHQTVHAFVKGLVSIQALNEAQRSHAGTEALDVGLVLVFIEAFAEGFGIIGRGNLDGYLIVQGIGLVFAYVHNMLLLFISV